LKTVLISTSDKFDDERNELCLVLDRALIEFVLDLMGPNTICIPVVNSPIETKKYFHLKPELVILSGGRDISYDDPRTHTELELLDLAQKYKIPLLGICRGMQLIVTANRGTLEHFPNQHIGFEKAFLNGQMMSINSYHKWKITNVSLDFRGLMFDEDGFVEAFESVSGTLFGIMWHPERNKSEIWEAREWLLGWLRPFLKDGEQD